MRCEFFKKLKNKQCCNRKIWKQKRWNHNVTNKKWLWKEKAERLSENATDTEVITTNEPTTIDEFLEQQIPTILPDTKNLYEIAIDLRIKKTNDQVALASNDLLQTQTQEVLLQNTSTPNTTDTINNTYIPSRKNTFDIFKLANDKLRLNKLKEIKFIKYPTPSDKLDITLDNRNMLTVRGHITLDIKHHRHCKHALNSTIHESIRIIDKKDKIKKGIERFERGCVHFCHSAAKKCVYSRT